MLQADFTHQDGFPSQWRGKGGAEHMRLRVIRQSDGSLVAERSAGASQDALWKPFRVTQEQLRGAFVPDPRGWVYSHLSLPEYAAVQRLVACEQEGLTISPDDDLANEYTEALVSAIDNMINDLAVTFRDMLPDAPVEHDGWRRIVVACLRDDFDLALAVIAPEGGA